MRRHVVLLTYGEPPSAAFLAQLRYSWRILLGLTRSVAPIPPPLLPVIALSRARTRWSLWRRERYGSPLEAITREQAQGLAAALAARAPRVEWRVHAAYEFRDPLLPSLLRRLPADEPVDILPMYVADSAFTHEISRATLRRLTPALEARTEAIRVLPPLPEPAFVEIAARHIEREVAARGIGGPDCALLLVAHGTLLEPPRPMETGHAATERIAAAIAARMGGRFGVVRNGWLNHVYGGRWTEPPADQALREIAETAFRRVVYFPFGFSADNAESELEGRLALRTQPALEPVHLPCLNAGREYLEAFAEQIVATSAEGQAAESVATRAGVPA